MDDHQCIKYAFSLFYFIFIDVPIIYFFGRKLTNFFQSNRKSTDYYLLEKQEILNLASFIPIEQQKRKR